MKVRYTTDRETVKRMTTEELRNAFLLNNLFITDEIEMVYSEIDRAIVGSAVPVTKNLSLPGNKKEMASDYFMERREAGVINIGTEGIVILDGKQFILDTLDMLYIGKGIKNVEFPANPEQNPCFYFVSYPAHTEYPSTLIKKDAAEHVNLGSGAEANKRTINRYIHLGGVKSCQLVMGMTELAEGSVWNTMPVHTHQRRSEIYLYFDMPADSILLHLMGEPQETRHIIIRDKQAVISPIWSIHSGCGTKSYKFIWAMGGENQEFGDMDGVQMIDIK